MTRLTLAALAALTAIGLAGPAGAKQHGLLGHYTARLSAQDHFNSTGQRLTTAAAIIRQDRANYFKFGKRDGEDQGDSFFDDAKNRARLEALLANGSTSREVERRIVNGEPLIHVDIFDNYVNVTVY